MSPDSHDLSEARRQSDLQGFASQCCEPTDRIRGWACKKRTRRDRDRDQTRCQPHSSESNDRAPLWPADRQLGLLGACEHLRWLIAQTLFQQNSDSQ